MTLLFVWEMQLSKHLRNIIKKNTLKCKKIHFRQYIQSLARLLISKVILTFMPSTRHDRQFIIMSWRTFSADHSPSCVWESMRLLKKSKTYKVQKSHMLWNTIRKRKRALSRYWEKLIDWYKNNCLEFCFDLFRNIDVYIQKTTDNKYHVNIFNQFTEARMILEWLKNLLPVHYCIYNLPKKEMSTNRGKVHDCSCKGGGLHITLTMHMKLYLGIAWQGISQNCI